MIHRTKTPAPTTAELRLAVARARTAGFAALIAVDALRRATIGRDTPCR
jgi:hypothetical protein